MRGNRKFIVVVLYILAVTFIGFSVVYFKQDSLMGAGTWAAGMASGVAAFMWGNAKAKEHSGKEGNQQ
jgi:ABC-type antimicrobial peptide transport system permease subunit